MTANVEIINNPYAHKMKILINGNPPSAFSMLDKFYTGVTGFSRKSNGN